MIHRTHIIGRAVGLFGTGLAACAIAAAPVSASQLVPFNANIAGTLQITGMGPNGPTSASYGGEGVASHLGLTRMDGTITIVGPAECPDGFLATHTDILTAANGDQVVMTISESSCPHPTEPGRFDCSGTYTVTGGTGRYSRATGSGNWSGSLALTPSGSGTFTTTYTGVLSPPQ